MTDTRLLRAFCALLALLSVAPLLAWAYGAGSFASWYWRVTVPALALLLLISLWIARESRTANLHAALVAGLGGGLLGTMLYDVVRIPGTLFGLRLLAPIDSYGVLLLDAAGSSPRTGVAGWVFHTTNGVCFALAYALVASGRSRWWAVGWALVLESVAVLSPYAEYYGLSGKWNLIAIAYAAHVPYGYAIGVCCEDPQRTVTSMREIVRKVPGTVLVAVTAAGLLLWQTPWSTPGTLTAGDAVAPGPSAVIVRERFSPQWVRVAPGQCAVLRNDDAVTRVVGGTAIEPGQTGPLCATGNGVHRVKITGAYTGGFVIVDPEAP
jgi:hypothetical protein